MKQSHSVLRIDNIPVWASALLLYAPTSTALAGGLYLNEFKTPGMSRLQGKQLHLSGGLVVTQVEFDADAVTPIAGSGRSCHMYCCDNLIPAKIADVIA